MTARTSNGTRHKGGPETWQGRVVVITGASRGIGAALARRVVGLGARVGLVARGEEDLARIMTTLPSGTAVAETADVTDAAALGSALNRIAEALGPIDVLVNNAGVGHYAPVLDTSAEDLDRLWRVNVVGAHYAVRAVVPAMVERGRGVVVNVASIAGRIGAPMEGAYSATKFAIVGMSESLQAELDGTGVRVCLVDPGPVDTGFFDARGVPYSRTRPKAIPAEQVADAIVDAVDGGRDEVFVPRWLRAAVVAKTAFPSLYRASSRIDRKLQDPTQAEVPNAREPWRKTSFWMGRGDYEPQPRLDGDHRCDVVVMGGGFTGLWTAIHLKEADPGLAVTVLEGEVAGFGASGRNGGFAMTMVGRNIHDLLRKVGPERARATHLAMRQTLGEIEEFCAKEGIDAHITNPGLLTVSNGPEQDVRIRHDLEAAARLGLDDFHELSGREVRELVHSDQLRCGHLEDDSLLVDPAALSRGLRDAALRRGVRVCEMTPVTHLQETADGVEAETPFGTVHADRAVIATNAYAHALPELRRYVFTVFAHIVVTEPLTDEQWGRIGWDRRMGIEDKRIMPHFHRPTPDGRILWGGRDAPVARRGPDARRERTPRVYQRLEETFRWTFPQLSDVAITAGWAGPVCGTVNCFATAGWLGKRQRIAYSVGYAGHGVGPSQLSAKILRDMLLGRRTDLLELPMVTKRPVPLPPVALRWPFLHGAQRFLQRADDLGREADLATRSLLRALQ